MGATGDIDSSKQRDNTMPPDTGTVGESGEGKLLEEDQWDEEQLENAMEKLKELHIRLRALRTTIPRMLAPLATKHSSPETLYREYTAADRIANLEVQQFRTLMKDDKSTKVLEYAHKSRAERPLGIRPWRVTEHPDWLTLKTPS